MLYLLYTFYSFLSFLRMGKDLSYRTSSNESNINEKEWICLNECNRHLTTLSFCGTWEDFVELMKISLDNTDWDCIKILTIVLNDILHDGIHNYIEIDYS